MILISSQGQKTTVNLINGLPDLSAYSGQTESVLQEAFDKGDYIEFADPVEIPVMPVADWVGLSNEILGGSLNGIYNRLTTACFLNPATATVQEIANANNIAVAAGKLDQAVAVTQREGAVAASLQLLIGSSDYRFTQAEKDLWITKSAELNFTSLVHLP